MAIQLAFNSLAFASYIYICWFITSDTFIETLYQDITGVKRDL